MGTFLDLIDYDALNDTGPFRSVQTTNLLPSGPVTLEAKRSQFNVTEAGSSPHGGIGYVDQAVGGVVGPREDASVFARFGIRPFRSRTSPLNGEYIGGNQPVEIRTQGRVGLSNRASVGVRARAAQATNIPDQGAVVAAFTTPAFAAFLDKVRGR